MTKISLASYTIRVKDKTKRNNSGKRIKSYAQIDDFANNADIFDILNDFLNLLKADLFNDQEQKTLIRVTKLIVKDRKLTGIIETGIYGYESDLYDTNKHRFSYKKQAYEAEMLPFYFLISTPKDANEGIVILQRFGNFGIKTNFSSKFREYFNSQYNDFAIEINPLVPEQIVKNYLKEGSLKKLRFVKFNIPTDITDAFDEGHEEQEGYIELVVSAKRNSKLFIFDRIRDFLDGHRELNRLIELDEINFEYDTVKVEVVVGGERRIVNLSDWRKIRSYYDITGEVSIDPSGHPSFDSINKIAIKLHNELFTAIGKEKTQEETDDG